MASSSGGRRTKVERVVDEYDLGDVETELVERWTGESGERWSLRDLADYFNEQVLATALADADMQPLDGEVENYYRLLSADDVSAGARTEARSQLERAGVDVDALQDDFVSHQAIHTYLTDRKEVSYEGTSDEERLSNASETLRRLERRTESVAENTVDRLRNAGDLDVEDFSVLVSVGIVCEECGRQHDVESLLEQGGCDCQ